MSLEDDALSSCLSSDAVVKSKKKSFKAKGKLSRQPHATMKLFDSILDEIYS